MLQRVVLICLLLCGIFLWFLRPAKAQFNPNRKTGVSRTARGISKYTAGRWGLLELKVTNRDSVAADPVSVSWLKDDINLEFGRQLTVPPRSTRTSWYPIYIPRNVTTSSRPDRIAVLDLQSNTRSSVNGVETIQRGDSFDRVDEFPLKLLRQQRCITFLSDRTRRQEEILQTLSALFRQRTTETFAPIHERFLPPTIEGYDVADVIIVAGTQLTEDSAALAAVMEWVLRGGTLWIMLDQISPAAAARITGDVFPIEAVDQVNLTDFAITSENRVIDIEPEIRELERPVEFVRVLTDRVLVTHRIDGWPAAFSRSVGQGQIVCTTLAIEGWHIPADWHVQETLTPQMKPYRDSPVMRQFLTTSIHTPREKPVPQAAQENWVNNQIGAEVPDRNLVLALLAGFFLLMTVGTVLLKRLGRIEQTGLGIFLLTTVTVGGLTTVGLIFGNEDDTVAEFQFISIEPGQPQAHVEGVAATYLNQPADGPLCVPNGGLYLPDRSGTGMGTWRRQQEDPPAWSFQNSRLPVGIRMTPFERSIRLSSDVSAEGTFNPEGFVGTLHTGPFGQLEDITIATHNHFTASTAADASGRFVIRPGNVLPPGEFFSGTLLNDTQQQRQRVLQRTLTLEGRQAWYPNRLMLLGWTEAVAGGIEFPVQRKNSTALVGIPIELRSPPPGSDVKIPSLFLRMKSIRSDNQAGFSSSYSNAKALWSRMLYTGTSTLRFQIPEPLLPLDITSVVYRLKLSAPLRRVRLTAGLSGKRMLVTQRDSMVGEFSFTLTDREALALDPKGGLQIELIIGDVTLASDEENIDEFGEQVIQRDQSWQVYWIQAEVTGRTSSQQQN
ncbi:MAG: hypothetical protein VB858_14115 [Planctomycetaceae bacterium]